MDEERLTLLEPGPEVQTEPSGLVPDEERRGLLVGERLRGGERHRGLEDRILGEGAVGQARTADDPVPDLPVGDVGPDLDDLEAALDPGGERQRRLDLVQAATHEDVGEVGRGREGADPQLGARELREVDLDLREDILGFSELDDLPCAHEATLRWIDER